MYLGGLGDDPQSEHLASRQEVGGALASTGVALVELRAAVVLGVGSVSFEMLRYLTERLPFMICPRWVHTAIQPIASSDVIRYLVAALDVEPGMYEIGGADVTTYRDMIAAYADVRGLRQRLIIDVPLLTPRLSSYWLDLVTPVDRHVSHALIESLVTEVIVGDRARTDSVFGIEPMGLVDALAAALNEQARVLDCDVLSSVSGLHDGVYVVRVGIPVPPDVAARIDDDLDRIGDSYEWYGLASAWRARAMLGRLVGEVWTLGKPRSLREGETVDWWTVTRRQSGTLVLRSSGWFPGEGWLGYRVDERGSSRWAHSARKAYPASCIGRCSRPCTAKCSRRSRATESNASVLRYSGRRAPRWSRRRMRSKKDSPARRSESLSELSTVVTKRADAALTAWSSTVAAMSSG